MKKTKGYLLIALALALIAFQLGCAGKAPADVVTPVPATDAPTPYLNNTVPPLTEAPEQTPEARDEGPLFRDLTEAGVFSYDLTNMLANTIEAKLGAARGVLGNDPRLDAYSYRRPLLMSDDAAMLFLSGGVDPETVTAMYERYGYENTALTAEAEGRYRLTYSDIAEDDSEVRYETVFEFANDRLCFTRTVNGSMEAYYECIPLGEGRFAMQSLTERAIVKLISPRDPAGGIASLIYSETRNAHMAEGGYSSIGAFMPWSVCYDPEADSIFGLDKLSDDWATEKEAADGLAFIIELAADGGFELRGALRTGPADEPAFEPFEPCILPAS